MTCREHIPTPCEFHPKFSNRQNNSTHSLCPENILSVSMAKRVDLFNQLCYILYAWWKNHIFRSSCTYSHHPIPLLFSSVVFPLYYLSSFTKSHESKFGKAYVPVTVKFFLQPIPGQKHLVLHAWSSLHHDNLQFEWDTRCAENPTGKLFFTICKLSHTNLFWKTHMMIDMEVSKTKSSYFLATNNTILHAISNKYTHLLSHIFTPKPFTEIKLCYFSSETIRMAFLIQFYLNYQYL